MAFAAEPIATAISAAVPMSRALVLLAIAAPTIHLPADLLLAAAASVDSLDTVPSGQ
jgi:hypothetical protein